MSKLQASVMLLLAAFLWGAGNVAQKTVLADLGPATVVGLRCMIGALFVLPLTLREVRNGARLSKEAWPCFTLGTACFCIAVLTYQTAFGHTSVTNAGFFVNTCTIMTPIAAWLLVREKPGLMTFPAIALALSGLYLMAGGRLDSLRWGDGLALVAAAFYAIWAVQISIFVRRHGLPCSLILGQLLVTGLVGLLFGLMFETVTLPGLKAAWLEIVFLGVFSTGLAYLLQTVAQQFLQPSVAMVIVSAEAVFGAGVAHWFLGEALGPMGLLGAALLISGIIMVQLSLPMRWLRGRTIQQPFALELAVADASRPDDWPPSEEQRLINGEFDVRLTPT
jgi:drug/metabolite transporter (DMT)-like permease